MIDSVTTDRMEWIGLDWIGFDWNGMEWKKMHLM